LAIRGDVLDNADEIGKHDDTKDTAPQSKPRMAPMTRIGLTQSRNGAQRRKASKETISGSFV
jgi:hypothetical protein